MPRKSTKATTTSNKKGSTSHEKGSNSPSKTKKVSVTIEPAKTRQKRSKKVVEPSEPKQIEIIDKSRKTPQQVEVKIIYNPEKEVKYLMADMTTKEAYSLLKRLWKFYRQLKKNRKLEKKLEASRSKMVEALYDNSTETEEDE